MPQILVTASVSFETCFVKGDFDSIFCPEHLCDVFILVKFINVLLCTIKMFTGSVGTDWCAWTHAGTVNGILNKTILNRNYTQHIDPKYIQNEGLAMGAPTSAILAEAFMQYLEHYHHVMDYYRYVDDILIIYNEDCTNTDDMLKEFNSIHPNIQYTIQNQTNNKLNYLDVSIKNIHNRFTFNIYKKPMTSDQLYTMTHVILPNKNQQFNI
jgi:hypothetical protein